MDDGWKNGNESVETPCSKQKLTLTTIQVILNYQYVINMHINILQLNQQASQASLAHSLGQETDCATGYTYADSQALAGKLAKQPNMQSDSAQFKTEQVLYSAEGTKVLLMSDTNLDTLFVAKITQMPKINSSLSLHLNYETQFYTRLSAVDVSHLAKINKFSVDESKCTRIMEFACRGDITRYVDDAVGCHSAEEKMQHLKIVKNILWQVVKGMEEAHNLGYALRDIKPSNILVNHAGKVLLCDFGLVAPFGEIDPSTCGTPEYMAPERLGKRRSSLPIQAEVDYWSLGIMAFQLLMGYTPYAYVEDDIEGLLESMYGGYISFDEQLPNYCKRFIFSLLQTNPAKRMGIEKIKQHEFFNDVQQQPLLNQRCGCRNRSNSCS